MTLEPHSQIGDHKLLFENISSIEAIGEPFEFLDIWNVFGLLKKALTPVKAIETHRV